MAAKDDIDLISLLGDESLYEAYKAAPSLFSNNFNAVVWCVTTGLLFLCMAAHLLCRAVRDVFAIPFVDLFGVWANAGITLSATILGFVIAGFAVLCTVLRPQTLIALHQIPNPRYGKSQLRLLFLEFVVVVVQYLMLLFVSVVATVVGGKNGPAVMFGVALARADWHIPFALAHLILVAWGGLFLLAVLSLKSFSFNLYSTLLLGLVDAADDVLRQRKRDALEKQQQQLSSTSCGTP